MLPLQTRSILLLVFGAIAAGVGASLVLVEYGDMPQLAAKPNQVPGGVKVTYYPDRNVEKISKKLYQPVELSLPANTRLEDVLIQLSEKCDVEFFFDTDALNADQIHTIRNEPLAERIEGPYLEWVLGLLLGRFDIRFRIGNRGIVLTTHEAADQLKRWAGRIDVTCKCEPFERVLRDLAEKCGRPINVMGDDPQVSQLSRQPITVDLRHAEVQTAVRIVAAMANLAVFDGEGGAFVSTRERVREFALEYRILPAWTIPPLPPVKLEPLIRRGYASPKRR